MQLPKPTPLVTPTGKPFWDALAENRVDIQQCDDCGKFVFYPRMACSHCLSLNLTWKTVSGEGTVYTYCLPAVPTAPQFKDEMPQKLAVIELPEGVRITSTLTNVDEADIKIGMKVKPFFDRESTEGLTMLRFQPIDAVEQPAPQVEEKAADQDAVTTSIPTFDVSDLEGMKSLISDEFGPWGAQLEVTQEIIDAFAELTGDDYWIHTDPEMAKKKSPFGGTIAHGFLTLVLMPKLSGQQMFEITGFNNMANYGTNRLRFSGAVPAGSKIHMRMRVKDVEQKSSGVLMTLEQNIHVVGEERPALVYDLMMMYM